MTVVGISLTTLVDHNIPLYGFTLTRIIEIAHNTLELRIITL